MKINVTHEYSGHSDFWGGNGKRWSDNAGCLFAYYGATTSLRECVNQWIDDFMGGGDCDSFHEDVTSEDIRAAILDSLTEQGRTDYHSGALAECAIEYADANGLDECPYCGGECNDEEGGCDDYKSDITGLLDDRDSYESPIWVILVECDIEECAECENGVGSSHHTGCGKRTVDCPSVVSDDC